MKKITPNLLSGLLPLALLAHQLEEYYFGFPEWYSNLLNADLSDNDFLIINSVGFIIIAAASWSYIIHRSNIILMAVGTLVFVNGIVHAMLTMLTFTYSPGTLTSIVLFIPLGLLTLKAVSPKLNVTGQWLAMLIGVGTLIVVGMIAFSS